MKQLVMMLAAGMMILSVAVGCSKAQEEVEEDPEYERMQTNPEAMGEERDRVQEEMKARGADVEEAVDDLGKKVNDIVAEANKLVEAEKYKEALEKVQQGLKLDGLTDAQKKTLQDLINTIQKSMTSTTTDDAKKKVGGMLNQ